jgi:2-polyprenyl-6-methoxyphenol hydroxylase-like FAD-dependent oxidoreductase
VRQCIGTGKAGVKPLKMRRELRRSVRSSAREEQQALMKANTDVNTAMVDDNRARAVLAGGRELEARNMLAATGRYSPGRELEDAASQQSGEPNGWFK